MPKDRTTPLSAEQPRVGELERIGPDGRDAIVIGVEAPGFDDLSAREKRFAYLMTRAPLPATGSRFSKAIATPTISCGSWKRALRTRRNSTPRFAMHSTST
jgi:hypothetical protein